MIKNSPDTAKPDTPAWAVILDKETARYIFRALLLTLVFAWALVNLQDVLQFLGRVLGVLSPFLMGGAFAFVINILLRPLERTWRRICKKAPEKLTRHICLTLSTLLVLGILFAVAFMMLPSLRESGNEFVQNLPGYVEKLGQWWAGAVQFAARYGIVLPEYAPDTDLMMDKITTLLHTQGGGLLTLTLGAASSVLASLVNVLLALVFALYLLAKKEVVTAHLKNLALTVLPPKNARRLLHVVTLTKHTFTNFVTGQLTEAVIIGVLCFLGMLILGIPYAGAVSAFVGATALIPVFGAWIGGVVGAFLILLADPAKSLWFVVFLLILQQVEGNLIYPKVVGKSVGLPGLLVLMAVTLGGEVFGIGGMLFSVPVCAVLYSLYLEYIQKAQRPVKDAA